MIGVPNDVGRQKPLKGVIIVLAKPGNVIIYGISKGS